MGRRIIAIVAALVVALLGVVGVVIYAQAADGRAIQGQATQTVFIAKAAVPAGTSAGDAISQQLIVRESVVVKGVPQGALSAVTPDVAKLVATSSILPGEIILASRFGALSSTASTPLIPTGKIAITVTLADPQRIAPLLTPQSHIVIFDTLVGKSGTATTSSTTRVLLPDVEVIGVGNQTALPTGSPTAGQDSQPAAANSALVTVAASPADAQLLVHAVQTGNLLYGGLLGSGAKVDAKGVVSDATILSH